MAASFGDAETEEKARYSFKISVLDEASAHGFPHIIEGGRELL